MGQSLTLKQLTDKVSHLEEEMSTLRKEMAELRQQASNLHPSGAKRPDFSWANKETQKRAIDLLFESFHIRGASIGPQALQKKMSQSGLVPEELSRSLIEAREE
jgi:hypothetical protein